MKKIILSILIFIISCSKEPVNMDEVLFDRSDQWITNDDFSNFSFFNRKVYNGPAFNTYRSGEKREQGMLKNGYRTGIWDGFDKDGKKRFSGEYKDGKKHGRWIGFFSNGEKKYEGVYEFGLQTGKWDYYDESGNKTLEEIYFEGRIRETKKL